MKKFMAMSALALLMMSPAAFAGSKDGEHKPHHERGEKMLEKMFEKGDLDKDGAISKEEFMTGAEERFAKMDLDGDGKVTKEEAKEGHEKMREKWKDMKDKKEGKGEEGQETAPAPEGEVPAQE